MKHVSYLVVLLLPPQILGPEYQVFLSFQLLVYVSLCLHANLWALLLQIVSLLFFYMVKVC